MNSLRRFSSILSRSAAAHDDVQPKNSDPSASRPPPRHRPTGSLDHPLVHQQQHTAARALDQDGHGRGRVPEDCKFMHSVKVLLYDPSSHTWSPSEPGMLRLLQSLSTRMTRLQIHSTARGSDRHSRLLVNCFLTPSLRLDGAGGGKQGRRLKSGSSAREGRVFILASANDWASGEPHRQIFALKFSKTPEGLKAAQEFTTSFFHFQTVNTQVLAQDKLVRAHVTSSSSAPHR